MKPIIDNLEFLLVRIGRAHHNRAREEFESIGLGRGQIPVIMNLFAEDGQTNSQLAKKMDVTPATMTNLVKRMEAAGFVYRQRGVKDERVSRVHLTEKGRDIVSQIREKADEMDTVMFAGFSNEERVELRSYMERILNNLEI